MNKKTDAIDVEIGSRIRLRRKELSLTQDILAEKLCISSQRLEKCERGVERIGASCLLRICEILDVPVMFFFGGASDDALLATEELADFRLAKHHRAILQTALSGIEDKQLRARILAFMQFTEPDNER